VWVARIEAVEPTARACQRFARNRTARSLTAHHGAALDMAAHLRCCGVRRGVVGASGGGAPPSHGRGRWFETSYAHQRKRSGPSPRDCRCQQGCQQATLRGRYNAFCGDWFDHLVANLMSL
jgi:hypothetical protein